MDSKLYDEWSKHIHAVITFLKPFFNDWRGYASLVSALLGVGVLIMENQVLLRMRMGRWEILGYVVWCLISSVLGPIFDIVVMLGLLIYCRWKSARMHITQESIAKALLPAPVTKNYRIMGGVCITASALTLTSNVLYMLRGWKEPSPFYDHSSDGIRWMTSQIWYAIGMIFLFHVVTRPAQSGVVLFGKFSRDLWAYKWYLCILYIPVHFMLLELCDVHRENKHILVPLEIIVDLSLYNGPFLVVLLRILYLAWKVAYDEAVLTGAIFEDDGTGLQNPTDGASTGGHRRGTSSSRPGTGDYVGLAMVDLDEIEQGRGRGRENGGILKKAKGPGVTDQGQGNNSEAVYVLEDVDEDEDNQNHTQTPVQKGSLKSSPRSSPTKTPKTVAFKLDHDEEQLPAVEEQSDDSAVTHPTKTSDTLV
ncbi:hypothetical protein BG005_007322 [Podila minutissima]|nr:hypothetical protein BG005_007322 [Podila minutissima]